jgi:hypothetical protein
MTSIIRYFCHQRYHGMKTRQALQFSIVFITTKSCAKAAYQPLYEVGVLTDRFQMKLYFR